MRNMNKNNRDKSELRLSLVGIIVIVNSYGWLTILVGWTAALMAIIIWHY